MSCCEVLHQVRSQLLNAREQLLRDYRNCSRNWPEIPTIAAQNAITRAHQALVPLAYALGDKFGEEFCNGWDTAIQQLQAATDIKPGRDPVKPRRLISTQVPRT